MKIHLTSLEEIYYLRMLDVCVIEITVAWPGATVATTIVIQRGWQ